jgi:hypothetical protein
MNIRGKLIATTLAGFAMAGFSSISASARIVCNTGGDCWHVHDEYTYPPAGGIIILKQGAHYSWCQDPGSGYRSGGQWERF